MVVRRVFPPFLCRRGSPLVDVQLQWEISKPPLDDGQGQKGGGGGALGLAGLRTLKTGSAEGFTVNGSRRFLLLK